MLPERVSLKLPGPLLAEVASGARFGPNLVPAYRELLASYAAHPSRLRLRFGWIHAASSRT